MKFGVVVFPGSNCDHDAYHAIGTVLAQPVEFIWHQSEQVEGFDAILLPGGFAYGDYLRTRAIARFSPVMRAVERFARRGGLVLGICNGFQILLEAGLMPSAHSEGNYFCDAQTLRELERNDQIVFRYTTPDGREEPRANPNSSLANIAGIANRERNVLGLMPHPERASEAALGSVDGAVIL